MLDGRHVIPRAVGLLTIVSLHAYWFVQPGPLPLKVLAALLIAVSIVRPAAGLLAFAALAPMSTVIASACGAAGMGSQLVEQMALGAGVGALLRSGPPEGRTRTGAPATVMAVVAMASAVAMIPAAAAPIARSLGDGLLLQQLLVRQTAQASPVFAPVFAALVIVECALLAWVVERSVRRMPQLGPQLVAAGLLGHAGAAALNLKVIVGWALRSGDALGTLPRLLMTARASAQADWNAGASALLLAGVAGFGLAGGSRARRIGVAFLLGLVAVGLWITGSRIAFGMGVVATVAAVAWSSGSIAAHRRSFIKFSKGAIIVVLAISGWVVFSNPLGRSAPLPGSVELRWVMAKAGMQMVKEAPAFGVGLTKFYDASEAFAGPYLLSVGWRPRENAHNNFVQVTAELGLVGLAALTGWLAIILIGGARAQSAAPNRIRGALLLAIAACMGTWLTGHPLLVPEFAFVWWFYCGILAAMAPVSSPTWPRWVPWALVAAVLVTIPWRAAVARNSAELEHRGFGLSLWQRDDVQRYREAGASSALFLPAGQAVAIPLRRAPGAPDPLVVEVRLDGQLLNTVSIQGEAWQTLVLTMPTGTRRFELVDFAVRPPASSPALPEVLLHIGKAVPR